jgi:hypothetical protein
MSAGFVQAHSLSAFGTAPQPARHSDGDDIAGQE